MGKEDSCPTNTLLHTISHPRSAAHINRGFLYRRLVCQEAKRQATAMCPPHQGGRAQLIFSWSELPLTSGGPSSPVPHQSSIESLMLRESEGEVTMKLLQMFPPGYSPNQRQTASHAPWRKTQLNRWKLDAKPCELTDRLPSFWNRTHSLMRVSWATVPSWPMVGLQIRSQLELARSPGHWLYVLFQALFTVNIVTEAALFVRPHSLGKVS